MLSGLENRIGVGRDLIENMRTWVVDPWTVDSSIHPTRRYSELKQQSNHEET